MDLLPAHLLVDVGRQEPRRQLGVLRLVDDEAGGRLDRELIELARGRPVVEAADRLGGDPQGVDVGQPDAAAADRPDDLVDVHRLERAAALAHPHGRLRAVFTTVLPPNIASRSASSTWASPRGSAVAVRGEERSRPIARAGACLASPRTDLQPPRAVKAPRGGSEPAGAPLICMRSPGCQPDHRLPRGSRVEPATDFSRRRMLAGLRASRARPGHPGVPKPHRFPARRPVLVVGFVLAYRCGAASDFHRVPFEPGQSPQHQHERQYIVVYGADQLNTVGNSDIPLHIGGVQIPHLAALALREGFVFERLTRPQC